MLMLKKPSKPGQPIKLRTVLDCREHNSNTKKMTSPLPDIEEILRVVSKLPFISLIDGKDAYEQIRVVPEDVWKTAFATPFGTAYLHVMQQGDYNAPATFQWLMTWIFRDIISDFIHVYLNDIFMFSKTIKDHERHLALVFK